MGRYKGKIRITYEELEKILGLSKENVSISTMQNDSSRDVIEIIVQSDKEGALVDEKPEGAFIQDFTFNFYTGIRKIG